MGAMASQITSITIVYSTIYPGADQRKYQNTASLTFVQGIHRRPVNSPHKWPVTRKMFPFDDVIMFYICSRQTVEGLWYLETHYCSIILCECHLNIRLYMIRQYAIRDAEACLAFMHLSTKVTSLNASWAKLTSPQLLVLFLSFWSSETICLSLV